MNITRPDTARLADDACSRAPCQQFRRRVLSLSWGFIALVGVAVATISAFLPYIVKREYLSHASMGFLCLFVATAVICLLYHRHVSRLLADPPLCPGIRATVGAQHLAEAVALAHRLVENVGDHIQEIASLAQHTPTAGAAPYFEIPRDNVGRQLHMLTKVMASLPQEEASALAAAGSGIRNALSAFGLLLESGEQTMLFDSREVNRLDLVDFMRAGWMDCQKVTTTLLRECEPAEVTRARLAKDLYEVYVGALEASRLNPGTPRGDGR